MRRRTETLKLYFWPKLVRPKSVAHSWQKSGKMPNVGLVRIGLASWHNELGRCPGNPQGLVVRRIVRNSDAPDPQESIPLIGEPRQHVARSEWRRFQVLACLTGAPLAPGIEATMEVQSRRPQEVQRRIPKRELPKIFLEV